MRRISYEGTYSKRTRKAQEHGRHNNMKNITEGMNGEKACNLASSFYFNVNQKQWHSSFSCSVSSLSLKTKESLPTNTPHVFHVETTWKRSFPSRFNVKYTWSVCRVKGLHLMSGEIGK